MKGGVGSVLLGLILVFSSGCTHNKHARKTVTTRAAFDLRCPPEELELTVLDTEGARKLSTQIGAEGCGKQSVYIYEVSTDTWIANTVATYAHSAESPSVPEQSEVER